MRAIELDPVSGFGYYEAIDALAKAGRAQEALDRFGHLPRGLDSFDRKLIRGWLADARAAVEAQKDEA